MTIYHQSILKGVLLPMHQANGLHLREYDDHLLELRQNGEHIAFFSATGATIEEIQNTATKYLKEKGETDANQT